MFESKFTGKYAPSPFMRRMDSTLVARFASLSLASVFLLLFIFAIGGAFLTYRAGTAAKHFSELSDLFDGARSAVAAEESLERKYRLEPSDKVRSRHRDAGNDLHTKLERARRASGGNDGATIDMVLGLHKEYLAAIEHMFAAVDAGDTAGANAIDGAEVDPRFDAMEAIVFATADAHHREALNGLDTLNHVQHTVLLATPPVFILGIALVWLFALILRRQRRRVDQAMILEATAVSRSEKRFRALVQNASDLVLICASDGVVTYQAPTAETAWGYLADGLVGTPMQRVVNPEDASQFQAIFDQLHAAPGITRSAELRLHDAADKWRYVELILTNLLADPDVTGIVVTARDIGERKEFEKQLIQQAFHDPLTLLPNRALFNDRLAQANVRNARRHGSVGVLFLDLDNFKLINDSLGHQAGDSLLVAAANRLKTCIRVEDTVARIGGDEFVVLLESTSEDEAVKTTERIEQAFAQPFVIKDREFIITVSSGIALRDASPGDADDLLRNADAAMYRAKTGGKARHVVFRDSMHTDSLRRLELESDLRQAVPRGELIVHYQPIVNLDTGELTEVEALVRWQHPVRGLLMPGDFISLAEENGLIVPIGQWVLEQACRQIMAWRAQFPDQAALMVSVNLSARQFQEAGLVGQVSRALRDAGLAPRWLKLEITESVLMQDVETTIKTLWQLKALGVELAIDDFGTGYSSLAYLKRLPLDILKIDRSFIGGIGHDSEDTAIVQAIISMAKSLSLSVTAEGIETAEQAALLRGWVCNRGQGYYYSPPVAAASLAELLLRPGAKLKPAQAA